MPAAQGEVANREVRFTLRFRRTITIAARSVSLVAVSDTEFASNDALGATGGSETTDACERSISIGEDFSAGRLTRGLSERSGEGGRSGKRGVPGTGAFREQGCSGNEGVGEHVRTRFHAGLWAR